MVRAIGLLLLGLCCFGCRSNRAPATPSPQQYVILAPDWRNDVVHRISLDGGYEGDFLDPARTNDKNISRSAWSSPRGLLFFEGNPGKFWMTAERALTEWGADGRYHRTMYADSSQLEDPTGIVRVGDAVFVVSEDKKIVLVFSPDGNLLRSFGYPELSRADDIKLGTDGLLYVGSRMRSPTIGLVSVWDPSNTNADAKPVAHLIPPDPADDGTISVSGLAFDDHGDLLITGFARGRLERWDRKTNQKLEVLLDSEQWGAYRDLERGPDGLIYMSGPAGLYRFDSLATAATLAGIQPFFDARKIADRYQHEFSPEALVFVPRAALTAANALAN